MTNRRGTPRLARMLCICREVLTPALVLFLWAFLSSHAQSQNAIPAIDVIQITPKGGQSGRRGGVGFVRLSAAGARTLAPSGGRSEISERGPSQRSRPALRQNTRTPARLLPVSSRQRRRVVRGNQEDHARPHREHGGARPPGVRIAVWRDRRPTAPGCAQQRRVHGDCGHCAPLFSYPSRLSRHLSRRHHASPPRRTFGRGIEIPGTPGMAGGLGTARTGLVIGGSVLLASAQRARQSPIGRGRIASPRPRPRRIVATRGRNVSLPG